MGLIEKSKSKDQPDSLRRVAHRRFKEALFAGRIKPGDFLSQREICDLLEVPLGPVRESLKALESEGIVTLLPKRGIRVIQIDRLAFKQAIDARKIIEGPAVAYFAENAPAEMVETIKSETLSFIESFQAVERPDDTLFRERNRVDMLLHDMVIEFYGNPILVTAQKLATEHVRIFRLNIVANEKFFELPAINEHLKIIEA
ncbi:MAG: GntR family transcriptional regulator, partial [Pseudomonadota bacterium]